MGSDYQLTNYKWKIKSMNIIIVFQQVFLTSCKTGSDDNKNQFTAYTYFEIAN